MTNSQLVSYGSWPERPEDNGEDGGQPNAHQIHIKTWQVRSIKLHRQVRADILQQNFLNVYLEPGSENIVLKGNVKVVTYKWKHDNWNIAMVVW